MKRVLILDDDFSFIYDFITRFPSEKFSFTLAESLKSAKDYINNDKFDFVVANTKIPGGSTISLKDSVKDSPRFIFMSGMEADYNRVKSSGDIFYFKNEIKNYGEKIFNG